MLWQGRWGKHLQFQPEYTFRHPEPHILQLKHVLPPKLSPMPKEADSLAPCASRKILFFYNQLLQLNARSCVKGPAFNASKTASQLSSSSQRTFQALLGREVLVKS